MTALVSVAAVEDGFLNLINFHPLHSRNWLSVVDKGFLNKSLPPEGLGPKMVKTEVMRRDET
jgi:hypothetical protein